MTWTPSPRSDVNACTLPLDPQQGFLLAQLDGRTDVPALGLILGLEPEQVQAMLQRLVALGAVAAPEGAAPPAPPAPEPPEPTEPPETTSGTQRQLYEALRHLELDARIALARSAEEPQLSAWCFDPMPRVIAALLENPRFGPMQARLVARHHPAGAGLEALAARPGLAGDPGVRRALLRNPVLPQDLYRRLWSGQRLLAQYQIVGERDCPGQTRAIAREVLRAAFQQRGAEERVELILVTEGRCLTALAGLTIDGRTTALLCQRSCTSTLLVQNLASWGAAPPQLIAHLLRQDLVRRNAGLRRALERHPNAP